MNQSNVVQMFSNPNIPSTMSANHYTGVYTSLYQNR